MKLLKEKKLLLPIIVLFTGLVLVLIAFLLPKFIKENILPPKPSSALLIVVDPNVEVTSGDKVNNYTDNKAEVELTVGDKVKTDKNGTAYIIFDDNSTLSLDNSTEIEIEASEDREESFFIRINQLVGRTWSSVESLSGKTADYELETPNTIAAVRGTEFGCDVKSETDTTCYVGEHLVEITLKDEDNEKFDLDEGHSYKNTDEQSENIEDNIKDFQKTDVWFHFNECLSDLQTKLLDSDDKRILRYIRDNEERHFKCEEILGLFEEKVSGTGVDIKDSTTSESSSNDSTTDNIGSNDSTTPPSVPAPTITYVDDNVKATYTTRNELICSWAGTNVDSYKVSVGTSPGLADTVGWQALTGTSKTFTGVMSYSPKFYCNVIAVNTGGQSASKSSDGVYYDNSSGSFTISNPQEGWCFYGNVSGNGTYLNIPFSDLRLTMYVKRSVKSGFEYSDTKGNWLPYEYWHKATLSIIKGGFNFSEGGFAGTYSTVYVKGILTNAKTTKVLHSPSIITTSNSCIL